MKTNKRQLKRKRLIWIWMLVVTMVTPLLPVQQATVQAAGVYEWQAVGSAGFSAGAAVNISIALDSSGTPYVVYRDYGNSNKANVMKYNGSSWELVGSAGFSAGTAGDLSFALDSNSTPYVLYRDFGNSGKATVMKYDGSSWEPLGSAGFSAGEVYDTSIALDSSGTPYVVYRDLANSQKTTVMKYNGSSWELVGSAGFSANSAESISITLDSSGIPYVAYSDWGNSGKATVMKYDGSSWEPLGSVGFSAGQVYQTSIELDSGGTPYVVYTDYGNSSRATVMKYDGSSWVTVGSAGFSAGEVYYTSIALDSSGIPYVVYTDNGNSSKATVMKYDGSSWEPVGSAGLSAGEAYDTSIALDSSGIPYVVYSDWGNSSKATVMKFPVSPKYTVSAVAASATPGVGADEAVTLTVQDSLGNTDTTFSGARNVTISGYTAAPDGSYGSFNGTDLTAGTTTVSVTFANGVATANLKLNKAAAQTIGFSVAGVATPAANAVSITPAVGTTASMALTTAITAPASNGGTFAQQPVVTLRDAYGNTSTGDSSTVVTVLKQDTGAWTLTGTATATASAGVVTFTGLGATNAAEVTGAQLAFDSSGLTQITSQSVTLPWPGVAAPGVDSVTTGDSHVLLSWSEVYGTVSYAVYQGTASGTYGDAVATVTGLTYDATGLTNGTTYYFVVKAMNPSGISAASIEVSATPQVAAPGVPILGPATPGDARISLTWDPVIGSTGYNIFKSSTSGAYGSEEASVSGSVYGYDVTGLTNGTTYYFVIQATNPGGDSTASNEVSATPRTVPSAPTGVTAVAGNGQATVSFTTPANGGSDIVYYKVTAMPGNITVTGAGSSITVTGLSNGVTYTFTVQAVNSAGSSVASDASNAVTPRQPSGSTNTSTPSTPTTTPDPEQTPVSTQPTADVFNSSVVNEANLVKTIESKVAEAKEANATIDFADTQGHWAEKTIDIFVRLKLINGYTDGTFRPNSPITRAEFAVILNRVLNIQGGSNTSVVLRDIVDSWAKEDIENLVAAGVIKGYNDGTFKPDNTITREEMVIMLSRIVDLNNVAKDTTKGNFNDLNGAYAADEIKAAAQAGIVSGKGNGRFDPKNNSTRAEALQIILNVLELNPQLKTLLDSLS
ncbi:S-layer homology domain-containing protein [Cohnella sp. WQ 127256]|uniref:S-layer homology domain-containing protein n=1 Tax=Cohnella sp. WQ 127256 TaxID=2938790 RepID=UPI00211872CC